MPPLAVSISLPRWLTTTVLASGNGLLSDSVYAIVIPSGFCVPALPVVPAWVWV